MADRVFFWASLTHREEGKPVPYTKISPSFGTEPELVGWIRTNRRDDDEIAAFKRVVRGGDFDDQRLLATEDLPADRERLAGVVRDLKKMLEDKDREMKRRPIVRRPLKNDAA